MPYLSASAVVIHYEEALYQVYAPLPLPLRMMELVVTTRDIRHANLQSNRHHQQADTQPFTGWMPFLSPNQQC